MYKKTVTVETNSRPTSNNKEEQNGVSQNGTVPSLTMQDGNKGTLEKDKKEEINRTLKGDLSQYNEAKIGRTKKLKDRQTRREQLAQVLNFC